MDETVASEVSPVEDVPPSVALRDGFDAALPSTDAAPLAAARDAPLASVWIDRDLSWLEFNRRVLAEALDDRTPLLERAKFLAIFTSNLDEFFMKRMAVLRERRHAGARSSCSARSAIASSRCCRQQAEYFLERHRAGAVAPRHSPAPLGRAEPGAAAGARATTSTRRSRRR